MATKIVCPKCGSTNVNVTFVQDQKLKNDHGSCLYWLLIGGGNPLSGSFSGCLRFLHSSSRKSRSL